MLSRNLGNTDRIVRFILGLAVIAAGVYFQSWLGALGLIFVATALIGWCPLYVPFGFRTCPLESAKSQ